MNVHAMSYDQTDRIDHQSVLVNLKGLLSQRADIHDREGSFVQDNYDDLKANKMFSIAIPEDLGGGGMSYSKLADIVKDLGSVCGSTALSYAMHSHPVLLNVFKFKNMGDERAKNTLAKIANSELIIAGTGANDWLQSSGSAEKVDGGYIVNAHKRFVSGGPGAQVFVTSAVTSTEEGEVVLHFSIPFATPGVAIQSNWDTTGMRGTGSNDVIMKDVFVPQDAIIAQRPAGRWHPLWDMIIPIAMPVIVSCYLGLAEKAYELALKAVKANPEKSHDVGEMRTQLVNAQLARNAMVEQCNELAFTPCLENSERIFVYKAIATKSIQATVQLAANIVGGPGFFRGGEIERIQRDVRALHFHPLPESKQLNVSGRTAMGLDPF